MVECPVCFGMDARARARHGMLKWKKGVCGSRELWGMPLGFPVTVQSLVKVAHDHNGVSGIMEQKIGSRPCFGVTSSGQRKAIFTGSVSLGERRTRSSPRRTGSAKLK